MLTCVAKVFWVVERLVKRYINTVNLPPNGQMDRILPMQTFNNWCISISLQNHIHSQLLCLCTRILSACVRVSIWHKLRSLPYQKVNKTHVPAMYLDQKWSLSSKTFPNPSSHCCNKAKSGANLQRKNRCCEVFSARQKAWWLLALWSTHATCPFLATTLHWRPALCFTGLYRDLQLPLRDEPSTNTPVHLDSWTPAKDALLRTLTATAQRLFGLWRSPAVPAGAREQEWFELWLTGDLTNCLAAKTRSADSQLSQALLARLSLSLSLSASVPSCCSHSLWICPLLSNVQLCAFKSTAWNLLWTPAFVLCLFV